MIEDNIPSRYVTRYYMEIDMENDDKGKVCCLNIPAGTTCSPISENTFTSPNESSSPKMVTFKLHPSWDGITPEEKGYLDRNPVLLPDRVVTTRRVKRADT